MSVRAALLLLALPFAVLATDMPTGAHENPAPSLHIDPFERPELLTRPPPERVQAVVETAPAPPPGPWKPELRAVMLAGHASVANVAGQLVGMGEEVDGHRLLEVTERRAVFEKDGILFELVMQ